MTALAIKCQGASAMPIESLVEFQGDLKSLADEDYHKFKAQLLELGFCEPITVWKTPTTTLIANGHQRLRTLVKMKHEGHTIPSIPVSFVHPKDKAEFAKIVLSLCSQYGAIEKQGMYDYCVAHEIPVEYLESRLRLPELDIPRYKAQFLEDGTEGLTDGDALPSEAPTRSQAGDLWQLGRHKLLCGDSRAVASYSKLLAGGQADMVFTDPPYNIAYEGKTAEKLTIQNDEMSGEHFAGFLAEVYGALFASMRDGAPIYVAHADTERVRFTEEFLKAGFKLSSVIVWNKNVATFGRSDYFWKHEPILYGWKPGAAHTWLGPTNEVSVWDIPRPSKSEVHPTMKPIAVMERAIRNSSMPDAFVLDPFLGSGSTLIACETTGRRCAGIELDPKYCDVILARFETFTGQKAVKIG